VDAELVESASEARRLVSQGAVRVNDDRVDGDAVIDLSDGDVIRVGRRRYTRIVVDQN
jgi:tyrosyl-tRNA synthetase